ncbi:MAG: sigma-54-dependent Fis family transcriptional regulator [Planctomycetes bacterium]|nr:sigma-54-dependent Fis family transcriptional regulator [Planctomycetota bacterium]
MSKTLVERERVLVVDDEEAMRTFLVRTLRKRGLELVEAADGAAARRLLEDRSFDLVLTDLRMPELDGIELLHWIKRTKPKTPVIVMTGFGSIPSAIEALKAGAEDYVTKPFDRDEIMRSVDAALEAGRLAAENRMLRGLLAEGRRYGTMIGSSPVMRDLYTRIEAVADREGAVLVQGESGTGKELVARAIHQRGSRRSRPFVAIQLGAIPPNLVAAELFGVEQGGFTGAGAGRKGAARRAEGGTLFLDEIGDVPLEVQSSLLRLLEQGEVAPIGAATTSSVDLRIIAATHRNLQALVESGAFRRDLYYRLNVFPIEVPPLRRRREDIPDLARHFLARLGADDRELALETLAILEGHDWPGNVRELENAVARMLALSDDRLLGPELLPEFVRSSARPRTEGFQALKEALADFEQAYLEQLLAEVKGNISEAARRAGVSRPTLHAKIQHHRIDPDRFR